MRTLPPVKMLTPFTPPVRPGARKKTHKTRSGSFTRGRGYTKKPRASFGKIRARRQQARKSRQFNRARAKA
jgi:hypothetical protein